VSGLNRSKVCRFLCEYLHRVENLGETHSETLADEIFGVAGDCVPLGWVKFVSARLNLLNHVENIVVFRPEGRLA